MKIPDKVKVAGHVYKVEWDDERLSNEGLIGETDHNLCVIYLCRYFHSKKISAKSMIDETLLHEILHAIDVNYNNHALSEEETVRLSTGLHQVLKDNFKF